MKWHRPWVPCTPVIYLVLKTPCLPDEHSHSLPGPASSHVSLGVSSSPCQHVLESPWDLPQVSACFRQPGRVPPCFPPIAFFSHSRRFFRAAITKCHTVGLKRQDFRSQSGGRESKSTVCAGLALGLREDVSQPASWAAEAVFPVCVCVLISLCHRTLVMLDERPPNGPSGHDSVYKCSLSKQGSHAEVLGFRLPHATFQGDAIQPITRFN